LKGLLTNGRVAVALSAVALICAAGGGAYAATSSGKKISVCIKHTGGDLYKAKKCAKHDKSLTWNQAGIQGPQGVQGVSGVQGLPGPGAKLISSSAPAGTTTTGMIDGTWTYSLGCTAATPFDQVDFKLTGPGDAALLAVSPSAVDGASAETPIGNGYERIFQGGPLVYTIVLQNGTTAAQVQLWVAGTTSCSLFGSAMPLSTS
jgi:hypothetical protein